MADEHNRKHRKHNLGDENDETLHKNKYGFIETDNPEYYNNKYNFSPPEYLMRKPTPFERREMVINYIIRNNGKPINISTLATSLAVSVRTMQTLLHGLQKDKIIEIMPNYTSNGQQKENIYRYTGEPVESYGSGLQIEMLHDIDNKAGFRDYDWQEYKFEKQGVWDSFDELEDAKEIRRERKRKYLKQTGITDSAYGAENLNYIIIKYTHGLRRPLNDEDEDKPLTANQFHAARAEGYFSSVYTSDMALTTDGRFKFKIDFDNPVYRFRLYKFDMRLELKGTKQSPEVVLYVDNSPQQEPLLEITYWGINHVTLHTYKKDIYTGEFLYLYGELTSK